MPPAYGGPTMPSVSFLPSGSEPPHWPVGGTETVYGLPASKFRP